jgi:hypothetical protein
MPDVALASQPEAAWSAWLQASESACSARAAASPVLQVADGQPVPMVESAAQKVPERDWSAPSAEQASLQVVRAQPFSSRVRQPLPAQERQCEPDPVGSDSVARSAPPGEQEGEQELSARLVCLGESASPLQEGLDGLY